MKWGRSLSCIPPVLCACAVHLFVLLAGEEIFAVSPTGITVIGDNVTTVVSNSPTVENVVIGGAGETSSVVIIAPPPDPYQPPIIEPPVVTPSGPTILPETQTAEGGSSVTFTLYGGVIGVIGGGTDDYSPPSFQWRKNGVDIPDATSNPYTITNVQVSDAGTYTVLIRIGTNSTLSSEAVLSVIPPTVHFDVSVNGATQTTGVPIPVNVTAKDSFGNVVTDFSDTASFSISALGAVSGSLLDSLAPNGGGSAPAGGLTLGYSFTPNQDMVVNQVRHCFGTKVSLWTDAGTLLASQNVTSTSGSWVETPLAAPVVLTAGTPYRIGVFVPQGTLYYLRLTQPSGAPFGAIASPYLTLGDAFPTVLNSPKWPLVDLQFTAQSVTQLAVAPPVSGTLTQGVWTGTLTVLEAGTNAVLQATGGGKTGSSGQFNIVLGPPIIGSHPAGARQIAGKNLVLTTTATGGGTLAYQWWFNGAVLPGGVLPQLTLNSPTEGQSGEYWCLVSNAAGNVTSRVAKVEVGTALLSAMTAPAVQTIRNTGFELGLQLEAGRSYRIEGSTNLVDWITITNFVSNGDAMQFLDRAATNLTRRFYRVVRP